jgi:hypothetical protein
MWTNSSTPEIRIQNDRACGFRRHVAVPPEGQSDRASRECRRVVDSVPDEHGIRLGGFPPSDLHLLFRRLTGEDFRHPHRVREVPHFVFPVSGDQHHPLESMFRTEVVNKLPAIVPRSIPKTCRPRQAIVNQDDAFETSGHGRQPRRQLGLECEQLRPARHPDRPSRDVADQSFSRQFGDLRGFQQRQPGRLRSVQDRPGQRMTGVSLQARRQLKHLVPGEAVGGKEFHERRTTVGQGSRLVEDRHPHESSISRTAGSLTTIPRRAASEMAPMMATGIAMSNGQGSRRPARRETAPDRRSSSYLLTGNRAIGNRSWTETSAGSGYRLKSGGDGDREYSGGEDNNWDSTAVVVGSGLTGQVTTTTNGTNMATM